MEDYVMPGNDSPSARNERLCVVVNDEEQYSIWPAHKEPPAGWRAIGFEGQRELVLAYIEDSWADMRPRSVRRRLAENRPA
jgi:MbtH protein